MILMDTPKFQWTIWCDGENSTNVLPVGSQINIFFHLGSQTHIEVSNLMHILHLEELPLRGSSWCAFTKKSSIL